MKNNASFWDKVAARYAKMPVRNETAYAETLDRTRAHLNPSDTILEIGCGTGTTALKLADAVQSIVATDLSGEMIAIAEGKLNSGGPSNVQFRKADIEADFIDGAPFDVVLAFNLLHLLQDTALGVRHMRDLLKPGGLLISKTVCLADANPIFRPIIWVMQKIGKAPFLRILKVRDLEALITAEGFEILETGTYPAKPPNRFIVARKI